MFKVKIITEGKTKIQTWLKNALDEYEERLTGKMTLEWIIVKSLDETPIPTPYIALDPKGNLLTSEEWSKKMHQMGLRLTFLIGGHTGLSEKLKQNASFIWSLSPLTFTHQMTRLLLAEQLYRSIEIEKGSKYHK